MEFTQGVRFDSLGLTEEVQRALKKKNIEALLKKFQLVLNDEQLSGTNL